MDEIGQHSTYTVTLNICVDSYHISMKSERTTSRERETSEPLVEVSDLVTQFDTYRGTVEALDHVEFSVHENEIVGIVGESGIQWARSMSTKS